MPDWYLTKDGDRSCLDLFRRHYSCRNRSGRIFAGPGDRIILRTDQADALFVWRHERFRSDDQEGINCSVFRNESSYRSSKLIRQADAIADHVWPGCRHYTFVDPKNVRSSNPGFCFIAAGWRRCGYTKNGLLILEENAMKQRIVTLDGIYRLDETGFYVPAEEPEPRYSYRWALFWALFAIGSIAFIALGYVSYEAAMAWVAV